MAKYKLLQDLYRFPGFVPRATVRGIFGDPLAVVITLQRRRKKRSVAFAARLIALIMTSDDDAFAISLVETSESISSFLCVAFSAPGVAA